MEKKTVERWKDIYTTFDESEAIILKGLFEGEGIPCRIESSRVSQLPVAIGDMGELRIFVRIEDVDRAARVLEATRSEPEEG